MNDTATGAGAVSIRRPPSSTYLWTADGWIRELSGSRNIDYLPRESEADHPPTRAPA